MRGIVGTSFPPLLPQVEAPCPSDHKARLRASEKPAEAQGPIGFDTVAKTSLGSVSADT